MLASLLVPEEGFHAQHRRVAQELRLLWKRSAELVVHLESVEGLMKCHWQRLRADRIW